MANIIENIKGEITLDNVIGAALKAPGVKINREKFLRKELIKHCSQDVVDEAIKTNPAKAGVTKELINVIAIQVINYETTKVTGLSVAASMPGGLAAVGAAVADITSYFVFILRIVQKLAYLYGFEQFDLYDDEIDSETMNFIYIFMGVMFGVQGATATLKKIAEAFAQKVSKKIAQQALTKGTVYPIVKNVLYKLGVKITKQVFADSVASSVPIVSGVLSGGLTFIMFRPCCIKLKNNLSSYNLCDPEYYKKNIDVEYEVVSDMNSEKKPND